MLALSLRRERFLSPTQRVADDTGFSILSSGRTRYVPYLVCEWRESRRTIWGAELVSRLRPDSGYPPLVRVAAALAGAGGSVDEAVEYLDDEDREEAQNSGKQARIEPVTG